MRLDIIDVLLLLVVFAVALPAWLVFAYSYFKMFRHIRAENWFERFTQTRWWNSHNLDRHIDRPGIAHYHRMMTAFKYLFGAVLTVMAHGIYRTFLDV